MFELSIPLTTATVEAMKADLCVYLPNAKSTHRVEALARGLSFNTYAAMLAAAGAANDKYALVNSDPFSAFLAERGTATGGVPLFHAAARVAIRAAMEREQRLTHFGFGIFDRSGRRPDGTYETQQEWYARFLKERDALIEAPDEFLRSLAFVQQVEPIKTINERPNSYGLKHRAEKFACTYPDGTELGPDYVANGSLIAAAIHAGFRMKRYPDSPNVAFNMSRRSLNDLRKLQDDAA